METTDLIARANGGDHDAFRDLVDGHTRELQVHCYRILGLPAGRRGRTPGDTPCRHGATSAVSTSVPPCGTWLYQIATNRCLTMLRADGRRPRTTSLPPSWSLPAPTGTSDAPSVAGALPRLSLLDSLVHPAPGPEVRYEHREAISLAFITALQLLPPRQRPSLVLRDVLGYRGR